MCSFWLFSTAMLAVTGGVLVGGIQMWLREKSYVFTADEIASKTTEAIAALNASGEGVGLEIIITRWLYWALSLVPRLFLAPVH